MSINTKTTLITMALFTVTLICVIIPETHMLLLGVIMGIALFFTLWIVVKAAIVAIQDSKETEQSIKKHKEKT